MDVTARDVAKELINIALGVCAAAALVVLSGYAAAYAPVEVSMLLDPPCREPLAPNASSFCATVAWLNFTLQDMILYGVPCLFVSALLVALHGLLKPRYPFGGIVLGYLMFQLVYQGVVVLDYELPIDWLTGYLLLLTDIIFVGIFLVTYMLARRVTGHLRSESVG